MARYIESELQKSCVRWFGYQYPEYTLLLFAVPNGGKRNAKEAARLKAEGVRPGVTDLILLVPRGGFAVLCVELKTEDGRLTEKQKEWQDAARKAGSKVVTCRSVDEFVNEINEYLK